MCPVRNLHIQPDIGLPGRYSRKPRTTLGFDRSSHCDIVLSGTAHKSGSLLVHHNRSRWPKSCVNLTFVAITLSDATNVITLSDVCSRQTSSFSVPTRAAQRPLRGTYLRYCPVEQKRELQKAHCLSEVAVHADRRYWFEGHVLQSADGGGGGGADGVPPPHPPHRSALSPRPPPN